MKIKFLTFTFDLILIISAILLSFIIRFPMERLNHPTFVSNVYLLPFILFFLMLSLCVTKSYRHRYTSYSDLAKRVLTGLSLGLLLSISFSYLFRSKWGSFPSGIFLILYGISLPLITIEKIIVYRLNKLIFRKAIFVSEAGLNDFQPLLKSDFDDIVLTHIFKNTEQLYLLLKLANAKSIKVSVLPEIYDQILANRFAADEKNLTILPAYFKDQPSEQFIRCFDVIFALFCLVISFPAAAVISMIIALDSPGGIIFRQKRVGLHGTVFHLYKFRSMFLGSSQESRSHHLTLDEDRRVTRFGKFLRRTRLDELPQLINILKGDMSFVGPRPESLSRVYAHRALKGIRLTVRPGLTGLAQIEGQYHTAPHHKLKYDYLYIRNQTLLFNIKIIFKTFFVILFKKGS